MKQKFDFDNEIYEKKCLKWKLFLLIKSKKTKKYKSK